MRESQTNRSRANRRAFPDTSSFGQAKESVREAFASNGRCKVSSLEKAKREESARSCSACTYVHTYSMSSATLKASCAPFAVVLVSPRGKSPD